MRSGIRTAVGSELLFDPTPTWQFRICFRVSSRFGFGWRRCGCPLTADWLIDIACLPPLATCHFLLAIFYLPLATYHLLLTTCHLLLATCRLPLATSHSPPATSYLPLATTISYLPLATTISYLPLATTISYLQLNDFMRLNEFPTAMRENLREYFNQVLCAMAARSCAVPVRCFA